MEARRHGGTEKSKDFGPRIHANEGLIALPGRSLLLICLTFIYLTFIPSVTLVQSVMAGLKEKTGRSMEEWITLVKKEGPAEH